MTIREQLEEREHKILSPFAAYSDESRGRDRYEEACDIRPVYQRDRDRILHSKIFSAHEGENTGLSCSGRGSLPDAHDAHAGGVAECKDRGEGTAAQ